MENTQIATISGGCFWCTQAIFEQLKGVVDVQAGYTGGQTINPTYEQVCEGQTGHAEAIQIEFDPLQISFDDILEVFWKLHDPTTLNQQGADKGTQYRSAIFYHSEDQKEIALNSKQKLDESKIYPNKSVTEIVPFTLFYSAEQYHQQYYKNNSKQLYCKFVIDPKIDKLKKDFKDKLKI